jgi:hypothetical protein
MREMEKKCGRTERKPLGREELGGRRSEKPSRRVTGPVTPDYLAYDIDLAVMGYDTWESERNRGRQGRSRRTP